MQGHGNLTDEDIFTQAIRAALDAKAYDHAVIAIGTTKAALQAEFASAIEQGEGISQLAKRIDALFGREEKVRSKLIARTELTDVINYGSTETLRREGYQNKEWSTVIDGRERASHAAADGQVVGIQQTFMVGGSTAFFPGDSNLPIGERANCRCAVVGAGLPEDRKRRLGQVFLRSHGALEKDFVVSLRRAFLEQRDRVLSQLPS
jgi:uncharacterized protein with gpF-like domain